LVSVGVIGCIYICIHRILVVGGARVGWSGVGAVIAHSTVYIRVVSIS
jgi:hypothetical protein